MADLPVLGREGHPALTGNVQSLVKTSSNVLAGKAKGQPTLTGKGQRASPHEKAVFTAKSPALAGTSKLTKGPRAQVAGARKGGVSYAAAVTGGEARPSTGPASSLHTLLHILTPKVLVTPTPAPVTLIPID
jgi:hypothetical protein